MIGEKFVSNLIQSMKSWNDESEYSIAEENISETFQNRKKSGKDEKFQDYPMKRRQHIYTRRIPDGYIPDSRNSYNAPISKALPLSDIPDICFDNKSIKSTLPSESKNNANNKLRSRNFKNTDKLLKNSNDMMFSRQMNNHTGENTEGTLLTCSKSELNLDKLSILQKKGEPINRFSKQETSFCIPKYLNISYLKIKCSEIIPNIFSKCLKCDKGSIICRNVKIETKPIEERDMLSEKHFCNRIHRFQSLIYQRCNFSKYLFVIFIFIMVILFSFMLGWFITHQQYQSLQEYKISVLTENDSSSSAKIARKLTNGETLNQTDEHSNRQLRRQLRLLSRKYTSQDFFFWKSILKLISPHISNPDILPELIVAVVEPNNELTALCIIAAIIQRYSYLLKKKNNITSIPVPVFDLIEYKKISELKKDLRDTVVAYQAVIIVYDDIEPLAVQSIRFIVSIPRSKDLQWKRKIFFLLWINECTNHKEFKLKFEKSWKQILSNNELNYIIKILTSRLVFIHPEPNRRVTEYCSLS